MKTGSPIFLSKDVDDMLKKRVDVLTKVYLIKNRKKLILNYIAENLAIFMSEDRLMTSEEVMNFLQISRSTLNRRIKNGILNPTNPEASRNYRFKKSDVVNSIK